LKDLSGELFPVIIRVMMKIRSVITGVGVLAANGKGCKEFWHGLRSGRTGERPISLFEADDVACKRVAEVPDFDATEYLGKKGLRTLDRSTRLLVSVGKMAVTESGFEITDENADRCGVSVGATLGSVKSIGDFNKESLQEGPRYVNPALFPNTVINSPSSQVSIWNNIRGFSNILASGFTSSLDAVQYAVDMLALGRADYVLAGGVEEMCEYTFRGFDAMKFLLGSVPGAEALHCPFDRRRNGALLGEGAVLMALESYECALRRQAPILAEIAGIGYQFEPSRVNRYSRSGRGLKAAIQQALDQARLSTTEIDGIFANANSTLAADCVESRVIQEIFGSDIPVTATKSMTGECYSVSGAMAAAAAVGTLQDGMIPPTLNYQHQDPDCGQIHIVTGAALKVDAENVMVINFSPSGVNVCLILRKV